MNPPEGVEILHSDPGEGHEEYQDQPVCPRCKKPFLVREIVRGGEMLTCTAGCGARFWLDR